MEENGYVKIFRKFKRWGWYQDMPVKSVFLHCLLSASYCDFEWLGKKYKSGQFVTSIGHLANDLKLSYKQVRIALEKLSDTGEISKIGTNKFTVITVTKWGNYQLYDTLEGNQRAIKGQSDGKQKANEGQQYKNNKNIKNKKKEEFVSAYPNVLNLADLYGHCLKKD